jgi:DNA repair protein RadC
MKISLWPEHERPREKLLYRGAAALSDAELLAILFQSGEKGNTAVDLARTLLASYKSLRRLIDADEREFCTHKGIGQTKYARIQAAMELSRRYLGEQLQYGPPLCNPQTTRDFLMSRLRCYRHEVFACIYLDNHHRPIAFEELFKGTINAANVYPREVVKRGLYHNSAAMIFAHNHPSGIPDPSQADIEITHSLREALSLVGIRVLDHFIIGDNDVTSLAERGLI